MTRFTHKPLGAATSACIFLIMLAVVALTSCGEKPVAPDVAARVGSATLTDEEIARSIPSGLTREDSLARVDQFIDSWIANRLVSDIAVKNIHNMEEIDRMTEDYRRNLIMMEYRRLKVAQDTSLAVTDAQIQQFYAEHGAEMRLREPFVRGIFIAMSQTSPQIQNVRRWYRSTKSADIERLEKVGLTEAMTYEYFRDRWVPWSSIADKIPGKPSPIAKGATIDLTDNSTTYLLSVSDLLPAGASMPFDAARADIRSRLESMRQVDLDNRLRQQLYRRAIDDGSAWRRQPNN